MRLLFAPFLLVSALASQPFRDEGVNDWEKLESAAKVPPRTREVNCGLPARVEALSVVGALKGNVVIRWLSPRLFQDIEFEYLVRWQVVEGGCSGHDCVPSGEKSVRKTSVSLEGLQPFTRVCFTVIPYTIRGEARCHGKESVLCARSLPYTAEAPETTTPASATLVTRPPSTTLSTTAPAGTTPASATQPTTTPYNHTINRRAVDCDNLSEPTINRDTVRCRTIDCITINSRNIECDTITCTTINAQTINCRNINCATLNGRTINPRNINCLTVN